jgi:DNA gyrase/topoisomerase IV subunit A
MRTISLKAGQLLLITIYCIFIFALLYRTLSKSTTVMNSLYTSTMIQTMNGGNVETASKREKMVMSLQSILAFFITSGIIIVVIDN